MTEQSSVAPTVEAGGEETPVAKQPKRQIILSYLAKWENENGSLCAITPDEWMALMEPVANLAVLESPRQALSALTRPAPAAAAGVPTHVLVLREPTQEMVDAGDNELGFSLSGSARDVWDAMLAASPAAPAGAQETLRSD